MSARKPIHKGDSQSSEKKGPYQEDLEDRPNSSQSFYNTESGSDYEDNDVRQESKSSKILVQSHEEHQVLNTSHSPKRPQYRRHYSPQSALHYSPESARPYSPESARPYSSESARSDSPESASLKSKSSSSLMFCGFIALIAICIGIYLYTLSSDAYPKSGCSFQKLQKDFPEQDLKVWIYLNVGIGNILNKTVTKPGVYLFVHEGSQHVKNLVGDIASYTSSCFGQNMRHIEMGINDFNSAEKSGDYGYAIEKFKEKIQSGKVILIANLNEIPANAARALHAICDTESPIASDIVVFLTLTVKNIKRGNVEAITEDALNQLWGPHLPYNELDPLITRVTDQVIALTS